MTYPTRYDVIDTYRRARTIFEGNQSSKTNHFLRKWIAEYFSALGLSVCKPITTTLDQHSLFATDFDDMKTKFFFYG